MSWVKFNSTKAAMAATIDDDCTETVYNRKNNNTTTNKVLENKNNNNNKSTAQKEEVIVEEVSMVTDSKERVRKIKRVILEAEEEVRAKYSILKHQNAIGMTMFVGSLLSILLISWAYLAGKLAWYLTIPLMGLPISILHEFEHDLIHNLYFKGSKFTQDVMFSFIWLFKFHGNPWWRRDMHHWHHRVSGQSNDIEERLIGLGMDLGWGRLGVTTHPLGFIPRIKPILEGAGTYFDVPYMNRASMATAMVLLVFIKVFPAMFIAQLVLPTWVLEMAYIDRIYPVVRDFMVILAFPLILRQSCLVAMSTGCHYYGDIPKNNLFFQNQILDHWALTPLQIYCWWFGKTHIMHHYIPQQPFYMRPLIEKKVLGFILSQGVRKNDWGIIRRANRWNRIVSKSEQREDKLSAFRWFCSVLTLSFVVCFLWDYIYSVSGLMVVGRFFTYPIYSRTKWYQEKAKNKPVIKGVPHITNRHA